LKIWVPTRPVETGADTLYVESLNNYYLL
jgi:hypothetical protein